MLPTSAGVEPATSWSPVGRRIQLSHRGRLKMHMKNKSVTDIKELQRGITITVLIPWPFFFWSSNISWTWTFMQNMLRFLIILIKICRKKVRVYTRLTFLSIYNVVTLKIRSRSPKSNHFFPPPWWCIYASLVKFQPLVKEIVCTQTFYCINKFYKGAITPREWAPSPYFLLCRYT